MKLEEIQALLDAPRTGRYSDVEPGEYAAKVVAIDADFVSKAGNSMWKVTVELDDYPGVRLDIYLSAGWKYTNFFDSLQLTRVIRPEELIGLSVGVICEHEMYNDALQLKADKFTPLVSVEQLEIFTEL